MVCLLLRESAARSACDANPVCGTLHFPIVVATRPSAGGENDAVLDDSLLAQAFRLIGLDPAQGFKQYVGVLAQQWRTADRDG